MNNAKLFSDEAANIYERAIGTLLKKNMLLYFSFADYEEVSGPSQQPGSSVNRIRDDRFINHKMEGEKNELVKVVMDIDE